MTRDFLSASENAYSLVPTTPENSMLATAITDYNQAVLQRLDLLQSAHPDNSMVKRLKRTDRHYARKYSHFDEPHRLESQRANQRP